MFSALCLGTAESSSAAAAAAEAFGVDIALALAAAVPSSPPPTAERRDFLVVDKSLLFKIAQTYSLLFSAIVVTKELKDN